MSIYQNIFDLIHTYIYGGIELTPVIELTCTLVATVSCLLVVALPFLVVLSVIKMIMR